MAAHLKAGCALVVSMFTTTSMFTTIAFRLLILAAECRSETSTSQLAEELAVSQQSVRRILRELEKEGFLRRRHASGLFLTGKGRLALLGLQGTIERALGDRTRHLNGRLENGLGEGKYYVSLTHYQKHLTTLLGSEPYPGTLNLTVNPEERALFLSGAEGSLIPGYRSRARSYGAVMYYPVVLGDERCGLLLPMRSSYEPDKVELVASVNLRRHLKLSDGDEVVIEEVEEGRGR